MATKRHTQVMMIFSSPHQSWPSPLISISIVCSHQQRSCCGTVTHSELTIGAYKIYLFLSQSTSLYNRPSFIHIAGSNIIVTSQEGRQALWRILGLNGEVGRETRGGREYRADKWDIDMLQNEENIKCLCVRVCLRLGVRRRGGTAGCLRRRRNGLNPTRERWEGIRLQLKCDGMTDANGCV